MGKNENYTYSNSCYWLIPTDDRYDDAVEKIKCEKFFSEYIKPYLKTSGKYVFMIYDVNYESERSRWGWNRYSGEIHDKYCDDRGIEFKGAINISEYELAASKYNL